MFQLQGPCQPLFLLEGFHRSEIVARSGNQLGFEPGSAAWKSSALATTPTCTQFVVTGFYNYDLVPVQCYGLTIKMSQNKMGKIEDWVEERVKVYQKQGTQCSWETWEDQGPKQLRYITSKSQLAWKKYGEGFVNVTVFLWLNKSFYEQARLRDRLKPPCCEEILPQIVPAPPTPT